MYIFFILFLKLSRSHRLIGQLSVCVFCVFITWRRLDRISQCAWIPWSKENNVIFLTRVLSYFSWPSYCSIRLLIDVIACLKKILLYLYGPRKDIKKINRKIFLLFMTILLFDKLWTRIINMGDAYAWKMHSVHRLRIFFNKKIFLLFMNKLLFDKL
jgi:hypothetical protein